MTMEEISRLMRETPARRELRAWLEAPLSQPVRDFRMEALGSALGLGKAYLSRYAEGQASMGAGLEDYLLEWIRAHPDLSPNNPEYILTSLAGAKID